MFTMAARGIKPVAVTFLKFGFNNCSEVQVFRLHALHQYLLRLAGSNWVSLSICPPNVGIDFYILGQLEYIQNDLPQRQ